MGHHRSGHADNLARQDRPEAPHAEGPRLTSHPGSTSMPIIGSSIDSRVQGLIIYYCTCRGRDPAGFLRPLPTHHRLWLNAGFNNNNLLRKWVRSWGPTCMMETNQLNLIEFTHVE